MSSDDAKILADALEGVGNGHLVVVTGAGISLASGIPTFRGTDPDSIWHRDVTELGTRRYFESDPVGSWQWYTSRFSQVLDKLPNPGHEALVRLEQWHRERRGRFLLVTQNVDPLHERAGSRQLVKVHGSADRVRCTRSGCARGAPAGSIPGDEIDLQPFIANPSNATLPRCPDCDALLRPHVLWFDEFYDEHREYQWQRVTNAAVSMDLVLFVGTSFAVGVTDLFLRGAMQTGIPIFAVDPGARDSPHRRVELLRSPAETLLPEVCARLGA